MFAFLFVLEWEGGNFLRRLSQECGKLHHILVRNCCVWRLLELEPFKQHSESGLRAAVLKPWINFCS